MPNIYNLADSWNDALQQFSAIKMNVTNTASEAGSMLLDLRVGGAKKVSAVAIDGGIASFGRRPSSSMVSRAPKRLPCRCRPAQTAGRPS